MRPTSDEERRDLQGERCTCKSTPPVDGERAPSLQKVAGSCCFPPRSHDDSCVDDLVYGASLGLRRYALGSALPVTTNSGPHFAVDSRSVSRNSVPHCSAVRVRSAESVFGRTQIFSSQSGLEAMGRIAVSVGVVCKKSGDAAHTPSIRSARSH